jgi:hypothetical protein
MAVFFADYSWEMDGCNGSGAFVMFFPAKTGSGGRLFGVWEEKKD